MPEGKAVHSEFYIQVLESNEADVKREAAIFRGQQLVHFAQQFPTHSAFTVKHFLENHEMIITSQPSYSPNYAPADIFIFPKVETTFKGVKFHDI